MSEVRPVPVVWQLAGTDGPPYWTGETCDALRLLQESGLLVLVEPDYEAAWGYARHEDNGWIAAKKNENLVVLDKADVMATVDAALGIGGDE